MCYRCKRGEVPDASEMRYGIDNPDLELELVMGWEGKAHRMRSFAICPADGSKMVTVRAISRGGYDFSDPVNQKAERYNCERNPDHWVRVTWRGTALRKGVSTWKPGRRLAVDLAV